MKWAELGGFRVGYLPFEFRALKVTLDAASNVYMDDFNVINLTIIKVTYIVRGRGRVQVVGVDGKRVLETHVKGGYLFIVPRFFIVSKIADADGMEWFSIITTPNPIFSHLAGRTSVWKAMSPEILEAAFNMTPEIEKLFRSKRTFDEIFFAPPKIMVGLSSIENRELILKKLLAKEKVEEDLDYKELATMIEGFSGSDLKNLCTTAAYRPVRELIRKERLKELVDNLMSNIL